MYILTILIGLFLACTAAYAVFLLVGLVVGLAGVAATNISQALRRLCRRAY